MKSIAVLPAICCGPETEPLTVSERDELATRLKYAGVPAERMTVVPDRPAALDHALARLPAGERLSIVSGYTPTIEFRQEMFRRGWVQRYWRT